MDQEHKYATEARCEEVRQDVVDEILTSLPSSVRTEKMRSDIEYLVKVLTWGPDGPFEFAHFSDAELARGLKKVSGKTSPGVQELKKTVAKHRAGDRNVGKIWKNWKPKPTKPALADALWPVLERKLPDGKKANDVPIGAAVIEAVRLAQEVSVVRELRTHDE